MKIVLIMYAGYALSHSYMYSQVRPYDHTSKFHLLGGYRVFVFLFLPGTGKKEKMRKGTTHSSAKAKSTPIMSTKIFSDTFGVQNITKQS